MAIEDDGIPVRMLPAQRGTTASLQAQQRELAELDKNQLTATRKAAETWRTGLGGLLAIVTGALFIKGKESVEDLGDGSRGLLAAFVVCAIAAAGLASYKALRASAGQPEQALTSEIEKAGGLAPYRFQLASKAARDLRVAQGAAFSAMALLLAGVMVTWFANKPPPDPLAQLRVQYEATTFCGKSSGVADGKLALEDSAGNKVKVPLVSISALALTASCK